MRALASLTLILLVLAGVRADEKISAPVPKAPPAGESIDGKYMVVAASTPADRAVAMAGPGGGFPGGKGGGMVFRGRVVSESSELLGKATISKNEIIFEGRGNNYDPYTG